MTVSGFLPRRWRPTPEIERHAEAIAGVLHTAPLQPASDGLAIVSLLGAVDVLPYLVAIKSLRHRLRRGGIVIVDDGTLTGEDRAILAHHCGDPEILPHQAVRRGAFPAGNAWALLLTILDRRAGQYWIALDPHTVTVGPVPEIAAALASNRGFGAVGAGIAGFAAGGVGRALAAAFMSVPPDGQSIDASNAADFVLANEPEPIKLPRQSYAVWTGKPWRTGSALVHFPASHRFAGDAYIAASTMAMAELAC